MVRRERSGKSGKPRHREQVEKQNQWQKEKKARIRLMEYFDENDYFSTLTYRIEERPPDMATAKTDFAEAMKIIRREYKKRGKELRWIRNIEVGTRGAWHVHIVINRIEDTDLILKKAWQHGKVVNQLMYEAGGFQKLAAYITKTPKTDPRCRSPIFLCHGICRSRKQRRKSICIGKPGKKSGCRKAITWTRIPSGKGKTR